MKVNDQNWHHLNSLGNIVVNGQLNALKRRNLRYVIRNVTQIMISTKRFPRHTLTLQTK